jgi:putative transposase
MNVLRYYIPDSIVFLTQVTANRVSLFAQPNNTLLLREVLHGTKERHAFNMLAYVLLPDHIHLLIRPGDGVTHTQIMHSMKVCFTNQYKLRHCIHGEFHCWQRRYWDHVIRNEDDLKKHLNYIHYNPVRHGLATRPENWCDSGYGEWVKRGAYEIGWGWQELPEFSSDVGYGE